MEGSKRNWEFVDITGVGGADHARAVRILNELEANGVIGPDLGIKPRQVLWVGRG